MGERRFPIINPTIEEMEKLFEVISRGRTIVCNICHVVLTGKTLGSLLPGSTNGKFIAACEDKVCTLILFFEWEANQDEDIEYDFIHTEGFKHIGAN